MRTFEIQLTGKFIVFFIEGSACNKDFRFCFQSSSIKGIKYTDIQIFTYLEKWILLIFTIEIV